MARASAPSSLAIRAMRSIWPRYRSNQTCQACSEDGSTAPAQLSGTQMCGFTMTAKPCPRACRTAARSPSSDISLPATRSDADGLDCHRNGITAMALAPSCRAWLSARSAESLPKGCSGVATTLKPSRRRPKAESSKQPRTSPTAALQTPFARIQHAFDATCRAGFLRLCSCQRHRCLIQIVFAPLA